MEDVTKELFYWLPNTRIKLRPQVKFIILFLIKISGTIKRKRADIYFLWQTCILSSIEFVLWISKTLLPHKANNEMFNSDNGAFLVLIFPFNETSACILANSILILIRRRVQISGGKVKYALKIWTSRIPQIEKLMQYCPNIIIFRVALFLIQNGDS